MRGRVGAGHSVAGPCYVPEHSREALPEFRRRDRRLAPAGAVTDGLYCLNPLSVGSWTILCTSPSSTTRSAKWCVNSRAPISPRWRASWIAPLRSLGKTSRPWASSDSWACRGARSSAAPAWTSSPTTSPSTRWPRWTPAMRSPSAPTPTWAPRRSWSSAPRRRGAGTSRCWPRGRCWAASASPSPAPAAMPAARPRPPWTRVTTTS